MHCKRYAHRIAKLKCKYWRLEQTDIWSWFLRSATMNSTAFALKRVLERASGVMEGSQNPTLGTSVMNKWTFGLQFHRFATMHCVTFALKRVLECPFSRKCVRYARRIVKPDFRYRCLERTDHRSEFPHFPSMRSSTFTLKRVFERTAHAGSQNPTVGTGALKRPTFGSSFVVLPPCLPPLLL